MVTAKVFWSGRSQAVRLPRAFRVDAGEVRIRRRGRRSCWNRFPNHGSGSMRSPATSTTTSCQRRASSPTRRSGLG